MKPAPGTKCRAWWWWTILRSHQDNPNEFVDNSLIFLDRISITISFFIDEPDGDYLCLFCININSFMVIPCVLSRVTNRKNIIERKSKILRYFIVSEMWTHLRYQGLFIFLPRIRWESFNFEIVTDHSKAYNINFTGMFFTINLI